MARVKREKPQVKKRTASRIPTFVTIEEEAEFWDTHDSAEFEDEFEVVTDIQFRVRRAGPGRTLSIFLEQDGWEKLAEQARAQGVYDTTLVYNWILERLGLLDASAEGSDSGGK